MLHRRRELPYPNRRVTKAHPSCDERSATGQCNHATGSYYDKYELTTSKGIPVTMDFKDAGHYRVTGGWRLVA